MAIKYVYQRDGAPLLSWNRAPPQQTRAADAKALGCCGCGSGGLGSLAGSTLGEPSLKLEMPLPRAGAPEPLPDLVRGREVGMSGVELPKPVLAIGAVAGAILLYKLLKK